MLEDIRALLILQDRDRRLISINKDLEKLPNDAARAKAKLAADQDAVNKAHDAILDCELRIKRLELDIGTRKTTIARLKTQQFETRKNEEFNALKNEVSRYEADVDKLENQSLELMEELDALKSAHQSAEKARKRTKAFVAEDLASLKTRHLQLTKDRAEVQADRDQLATQIPDSILQSYTRLLKTKAGLAIVPLQEDKCGGCFMKIIPATMVAVHSNLDIARCENCGRILYAPE